MRDVQNHQISKLTIGPHVEQSSFDSPLFLSFLPSIKLYPKQRLGMGVGNINVQQSL